MNENWIEYTKRADFRAWAEELNISPLSARLIRNRDIETLEEARNYLYGKLSDLSDPYLMKDMDQAVEILFAAAERNEKVAIVSDFDDDGIFAGQILFEGLGRIGLVPILYTPDRVLEGYGINRRIIDEAVRDGCRVIVTCDNGIAAVDEIAYAKELDLTVVVTDHHEVQKEIPPADAVIDPKQKDCNYPCKLLCGAGVAFRLIQALYAVCSVDMKEAEDLLEYVAIATVADVMELKSENRILVREGLKRLRDTKKIGLLALMEVCQVEPTDVDVYHIGFILGPCFNAVGRLAHVRLAFDLLQTRDVVTAMEIAKEIRELNDSRKTMTNEGVEKAVKLVEDLGLLNDRVLVVYLPGVHESVVGIIAGKIKEKYYRPTFVLTDAEQGLKGSARSIEAYDMMAHLLPLSELFTRFGGHAMAAGVSIEKKNLETFRRRINETCELTEKDLIPTVHLDARVMMSQISEKMIRELSVIAPTGTGNPQPLFAMAHFKIHQIRRIGKEGQFLKMIVSDESGVKMEAISFADPEELLNFLVQEFGKAETEKAFRGADNALDVAFTYYPEINSFRGNQTLQIRIRSYKRIRC